MSEVKLRTVDQLKGCPMCGMKPAHGPTKVKHCQLHGEPYQDYRIWCRSRCSFIERSDLESAIEAWNDRPGEASQAALISELVGALEPFANFGEYVDLETEGFSGGDEFQLMIGDHLMETFKVFDFGRARAAITKAKEITS